jgi:putative transcriptional regulator
VTDLRVQPGTLLAAWPDLVDPNFMHTVVLIVSHEEQGAFGLVLNRASGLTTRKLLAEHPLLGRADFPVAIGGPVDHRTLHFLHRLPKHIPGGVRVDGDLHLGGDLDALGRVLAREPERARDGVRMFLGYAGWGSGQLEAEIESGSWMPARMQVARLFTEPLDELWRATVRSIGPLTRGMDRMPPDPNWN